MNITSIKDPAVIQARRLQSVTARKAEKKALLFGKEQILWAIDKGLKFESIFAVKGSNTNFLSVKASDKLYFAGDGIMKKISDSNYLVPFLAIVECRDEQQCKGDFIVVLDSLQDFGNIGSIIRTTRGFSIDDFMFVNMQTDPYARKVIDSSRGVVFDSNIQTKHSDIDAIRSLKDQGYQIIVTSPHANTLQSHTTITGDKIALIVGNETNGVSNNFLQEADIAIKIPMNASVESLNVSVSTGISIYELNYKQVLMKLKEKILITLGRQIGVTGKLIRKTFDKEIRQNTDLSGMQIILMMIMHIDQTMTHSQIEQDTALSGNELEQFLKDLIEKKIICFRENLYQITETGKEFLATTWPVIEDAQRKILKDLCDEEIHLLNSLLSKIQKRCECLLK